MPCYSRINSSVEFGPNTDAGLLAKALKTLGYTVTQIGKNLSFAKYDSEFGRINGTYTSGRLSVQAAEGAIDENLLKRTYSAEVVKSAAQRFGWQVKQSSDTQFQVTRRS